MHYYTEGNVFLNFDMNILMNQYEVKNFARKFDKGNNGFLVYESEDHKFKKFVDNESNTGFPYVMVKNRPRTAFPNFGPLQPSFYINGVVNIKDNLEKMLIMNPKAFNETMPVYRLVTPTGQDLIRIDNRVTYDIKNRFVPFKMSKSSEGKTYTRAESSMEVFLKYFHYKTGKLGQKWVPGQFDSSKLRLADFAKKEYLFTFSIWHRPTSRYYRLNQNRTNFMVTIKHSWGYFETYPMYSNNLFENVSNRHLLGYSLDGAFAKIYPNILKYKSFAVTQGPLKYSSAKIEEDYYGTKLDELKLTIKEKYVNVKQGDSVPDHFTKIFTGADREKKIDPADDKYYFSKPDAGGWGGVCKCPSGKSYFVGDEWNGNRTLSCKGGKSGKRWKKVMRKWEHMTVECAQRTGSFQFVSSYFNQGHSLDCKEGFLLTANSTKVTCSAPPQWDFLVKNKFDETILADHKEKNDMDHRPKFVRYTAMDDTCLVYPIAGWLLDYIKGKKPSKKSKNKHDAKECLSCVDGSWMNPKPKKTTKLFGKDCQKCKEPQCAKCDKIGCIYCKEGFGFFARKCKKCKKDQVYDPFTRRCFVKKINQYIDFHTEHKNKLFAVTDIFGTKENHTALFNFDIEWKKLLANGASIGPEVLALNVTSITTSLKWVVDEGKKVSQEVVKEESTIFSDLPLKATRTIYFRMPLFAGSDIQLIIKPIMKNPLNFQFYKMVNFKYSLQRHQQAKDKRMKFPENKEANKQVKAEHLAHKKGFPERIEFNDSYSLYVGSTLPEKIANISMWNARDEINGNWIQTWYKIGVKPKYQEDITIINIHGHLSEPNPKTGAEEFEFKIYYNYPKSSVYFRDHNNKKQLIKDLSQMDAQNTWNYMGVLVRKVFVQNQMKFLVYIATTEDDIFANISGQEVWDPEYKPTDYEIPKKDKKTQFLFLEETNTNFIKRGSKLDVGFGVHKYGHTGSDFSGTFAGPNFYKTWINPIVVQKAFYFPEKNDLHTKGKMRNFADPDDPLTQGFYITKDRDGSEWPFVDEVDIQQYGVSLIKANTYRDADNPNELNTIITGDIEIKDNLKLFGLENKYETIEKVPLFLWIAKNGTEVMKIEHKIIVPRKGDPNYYTVSKIKITLLRGWNKGKRVESIHESHPFQLSFLPNKKFHYKFMFWTTLLPVYYTKTKPKGVFFDMKVNFMDNQQNYVYDSGQSATYNYKKGYSLLLGQTFEEYAKEMPLYNHKYLSFSYSLGSHSYTKDKLADAYAMFGSRLQKIPVLCTIDYMLVQPEYNPSSEKPMCSAIPKLANQCYRDMDGKCIACRRGYYPQKGQCHKCHANCIDCNSQKCTLCKDLHELTKKGTCEVCSTTQYFNLVTEKCDTKKSELKAKAAAEKAKKAGKKVLVIRRLSLRKIKNAVNLTLNNQRRLEALEKKNDKKINKALKKDENIDDLLFNLDDSHDLNEDEEQRRLVNETIKQTMEEMKESNH